MNQELYLDIASKLAKKWDFLVEDIADGRQGVQGSYIKHKVPNGTTISTGANIDGCATREVVLNTRFRTTTPLVITSQLCQRMAGS